MGHTLRSKRNIRRVRHTIVPRGRARLHRISTHVWLELVRVGFYSSQRVIRLESHLLHHVLAGLQ